VNAWKAFCDSRAPGVILLALLLLIWQLSPTYWFTSPTWPTVTRIFEAWFENIADGTIPGWPQHSADISRVGHSRRQSADPDQMRISLAISLILAILGEMIRSNDGLGYFVLLAQRTFKVPDMYAGIFTLALLGYVLNRLFLLIESGLIRWHTESSGRI
jgi:ABC-type nitrate/sulfonate/bicarbonate transport system permease component